MEGQETSYIYIVSNDGTMLFHPTPEMDLARKSVIDVVNNLSAIAEENASATEN